MDHGQMTYCYFLLCLQFVCCSRIHFLNTSFKQREFEYAKGEFWEIMKSLRDECCKIKPTGLNVSVNANTERENNISRATIKSLSKSRNVPSNCRGLVKRSEVDSHVSSKVKSYNSTRDLARRAHLSYMRPEKHDGNMATGEKTTTYDWENFAITDDKTTIDNVSKKITKSEMTTELAEMKRLSDISKVENKTVVVKNVTVSGQNFNTLIGDSLESFELQCFGCNGEIMLDFPEFAMATQLRTLFSLKSNVFELLQSSDSSLTLWTTSQCDSQPLCDYCYKMNWFEKRHDGICRRLYVYYLAMEADGIPTDFVNQNKMSHFMIQVLKSHLAFDVLEEWWPPWVVFDARLNAHLCTARLLVYDVHRASMLDAVKQIRYLSLMTYTYRHRCNIIAQESENITHVKHDLRSSFDLGNEMKKALDFYNATQMSNRTTCVCKFIFLAAKVQKVDVERICHLGCFPESFRKLDSEWVGNLKSACVKTSDPTEEKNIGCHVMSQLILVSILFLFCVVSPCVDNVHVISNM